MSTTGSIQPPAPSAPERSSTTDRLFTPGLYARIKVLARGSFPAVLVDGKAILIDQDCTYVYVLAAGNIALRRDVTLGRVVDGLRIISTPACRSPRTP